MDPRLWAASLGLLLALAIAAPAAADTTTIGQIAPTGSSRQCFECTAFQPRTAAASPVYAVPAGNWRRLVAWRIRGGAQHKGHAGLRIFQPTATLGRYRMVNQAAEEAVHVKRASTFRTNISVKRGDLLGLRTGAVPGDIALYYESTEIEDEVESALGDPKIGESVGPGGTYPSVIYQSLLVNVSATLYRPPPETTITKHPPAKTHSRTARFKFRSDAPRQGFKCRLDEARRFKACGSRRRYRHLSRGRHVLEVRAVAGGVDDPTPAEYKWRVTG